MLDQTLCRHLAALCVHRKVFGILAAQLLLTAAIATPIVAHAGVRSYVLRSGWLTGLAMVASFVLLLVLTLSESARHKHPTNLFLLAGFTAAEGILVGAITSQYQMPAILLAVGLTAAITVGLTAYAMQTKRDFTTSGGLLVTLLLTLLFTGLFAAFTRSPAIHLLMGGAGALLFGAYIVYDVQLLAGNAGVTAVQLSADEYVVGAIQVYLDVVNLFLHLLRFISEMQRDS